MNMVILKSRKDLLLPTQTLERPTRRRKQQELFRSLDFSFEAEIFSVPMQPLPKLTSTSTPMPTTKPTT
jgi:hypothetical protein